MTYILGAAAVVAWLAIGIACLSQSLLTDGGRARIWIVGGVLWFVVTIALSLAAHDEASAKGPCLRYDTGYAMSGKVMTAYRYCVDRGEWVR